MDASYRGSIQFIVVTLRPVEEDPPIWLIPDFSHPKRDQQL